MVQTIALTRAVFRGGEPCGAKMTRVINWHLAVGVLNHRNSDWGGITLHAKSFGG